MGGRKNKSRHSRAASRKKDKRIRKRNARQRLSNTTELENFFGLASGETSWSLISSRSSDDQVNMMSNSFNPAFEQRLMLRVATEYLEGNQNLREENQNVESDKYYSASSSSKSVAEKSNNEIVSKNIASESSHTSKKSDTLKAEEVQAANLDLLNIVEKTIKCLKSTDQKDFINILEMLFNTLELPKHKRDMVQDLIYTFLLYLENSELEEIKTVPNKLENVFISNILRRLTVANDDFSELKLIGRGGFGEVHLGELKLNEANVKVAIKKPLLENSIAPELLLNEARIMCRLNHPNILKLLGFQRKPLQIFLEYMQMGNIFQALADRPFNDYELLKAVYDVASAMEYLAGKKFVYRDLGCRNVFVRDQNGNLFFKIGDFGTCAYVGNTSGIYYEPELRLLQYSLPLEATLMQRFTVETDVYTMGFFIWELYLAGEFNPFVQHHCMIKLQLGVHMFRNTGVLRQPFRLCDQLYSFVKNKLLNKVPEQRPSFKIIRKEIFDLLKKKFPKQVIQSTNLYTKTEEKEAV